MKLSRQKSERKDLQGVLKRKVSHIEAQRRLRFLKISQKRVMKLKTIHLPL